MSKFLLWGGSRLTPTRSCPLEGWQGVDGDDGGTRLLVPLSVVAAGAEGEAVGVVEEVVVVAQGAVAQAEEMREAVTMEAEAGSGREVSDGVGQV